MEDIEIQYDDNQQVPVQNSLRVDSKSSARKESKQSITLLILSMCCFQRLQKYTFLQMREKHCRSLQVGTQG